jgi:hypothetical protein
MIWRGKFLSLGTAEFVENVEEIESRLVEERLPEHG